MECAIEYILLLVFPCFEPKAKVVPSPSEADGKAAAGSSSLAPCQGGSIATAILAGGSHSPGLEKCRYMVRGGIPSMRAACSLLPAHCSIVARTRRLVASSTVVPMGMETQGPSCLGAGSCDAAGT